MKGSTGDGNGDRGRGGGGKEMAGGVWGRNGYSLWNVNWNAD